MKKAFGILAIALVAFFAMSGSRMALADGTQPPGLGTEASPYQVSTLDHLLWISTNSSSWSTGIYFEQTDDIDASGTSSWNSGAGFSPIGNSPTRFRGSYDGDGYTIDGLTINRSSTDNIGLFGYTQGATIQDLRVTNVDIDGGNTVGALVGYSYLNSKVENCYSTGSVSGVDRVGGLVGDSFNSTVSNSFWDTQTSGQSSSDGGTGKTTMEMKTQSTFTDAGWNFTTIWNIDTYNSGYPYLRWQIFTPTVTTTAVSSITSTSASSGGNVTSNGGASVTARGVCWSTSANPTK